MWFVGIDPGKQGALAIVNSRGRLVRSYFTRVEDKEYVESSMANSLRRLMGVEMGAAIEKVHAMPKQGVSSMFNFGMGFGLWRGMLSASNIPYTLVTPQRWIKDIMGGVRRPDGEKWGKVDYVEKARELFPDIPIKLKKHWGLADAALIAEWRRRNK